MTIYFAGLLLAYALATGVLADRFLTRAAWAVRRPATALRVWHACASAFLLALAVVTVIVAHHQWERVVVWVFHADELRVHRTYAGTGPVGEWSNVALGLGLVIWGALTVRVGKQAYDVHRSRAEHRLVADMVTTPGRHHGVRVLQTEAPAAYCLPGRGATARIVITSGAVEILTDAEVDATIEHERAHLRSAHHRMILWADAVSSLLGRAGILRNYAAQVRRLSEMAADDQAADRCGSRPVASALLTLCTIDPPPPPGGSGLLAMSTSRPAERIRRLLADLPAADRKRSALVSSGGLAVAAIPLAVLLIPAITLAGSAH